MDGRDGYVIVEAVVLLPLASVLILLLIYLCSYLYQGCFMTQASYIAAFRGSRNVKKGEAYIGQQLDEILEREVWSFAAEEREIEISPFSVRVSLKKRTPFSGMGTIVPDLTASWKVAVRDPAAYIRGIRTITQSGEDG